MKLIMPCSECIETDGFKDDTILFVEIEDGSYYEITCLRGHSRAAILTTRKFEILFEFGAMAQLDGYPREAVSSFPVALERFYEYWVKAHLLHAQIAPAELDAAWRQVSAQSERQLGAFSLLYIREYYTPAPMLPQRVTEFRNKVIHKGYIPTRIDCVKYGDAVLELIRKNIRELWSSHNDELIGSVNEKWFEARGDQPNMFFLPWMTLGTNRPPTDDRNLEDIIDQMEAAKKPA